MEHLRDEWDDLKFYRGGLNAPFTVFKGEFLWKMSSELCPTRWKDFFFCSIHTENDVPKQRQAFVRKPTKSHSGGLGSSSDGIRKGKGVGNGLWPEWEQA